MYRFLIVEDDIINRISLKKLLEKEFECICDKARNVAEAVDHLQRAEYNTIFLDLQLSPDSKEGGFQIIKKIKNLKFNQDTPIIIISGKKTEEEIKKRIMTADNVVHILIKPVEIEQIIQAIREVVDRNVIPPIRK